MTSNMTHLMTTASQAEMQRNAASAHRFAKPARPAKASRFQRLSRLGLGAGAIAPQAQPPMRASRIGA